MNGDKKYREQIRAQLEQLGAEQVRYRLSTEMMNAPTIPIAIEWLAEKDQEASRLAAASQAEQAAAASRAAAAAERAAAAAEEQARVAQRALTTARIANAIAIVAL